MRVKVEYSQASRETYKKYCAEFPTKKISFITFSQVVYNFNYAFRDYLLETGNKGKLPCGFGDFVVTRWKPDTSRLIDATADQKTYIPVDWKRTKELGRYIYHLNLHTNGYKFKILWFIKTLRFKHRNIWYFRPSRVTSRLLRHYINQAEYQTKYLSWKK